MAQENQGKPGKFEDFPEVYKLVDPNTPKERIMEIYTQTAHKYSEVNNVWPKYNLSNSTLCEMNGPAICAKELAATLGDFKDAKIIDITCGTGLVGIELSKLGFTNLDALDGNTAMLEEARKTGVYNRIMCEFVGPNKLKIKDDTYDAVVIVGSFVPGHLDETCFEEIIRIIKPGGKLMLSMNPDHLPHLPNLESRMQHLHDNQLWKWVVRKEVDKFIGDSKGFIYVFEILKDNRKTK